MSYTVLIAGNEIRCDTAEEAIALARALVGRTAHAPFATDRRIDPVSAFEHKLRELCDEIPSPAYEGPGRKGIERSDIVYAAALRVHKTLPGRRLSEQGPHYNTVLLHMGRKAFTGILSVFLELLGRYAAGRDVPRIEYGEYMSKGKVAVQNEELLRLICMYVAVLA